MTNNKEKGIEHEISLKGERNEDAMAQRKEKRKKEVIRNERDLHPGSEQNLNVKNNISCKRKVKTLKGLHQNWTTLQLKIKENN